MEKNEFAKKSIPKRHRFYYLFAIMLIAFLIIPQLSYSQKKVTGIVKDLSNNEPIPGVSVNEKGTSNASMTNSSGEFEISVQSESSVLIVSFLGYETQEIPVTGTSNFNIALQPTEIGIDEVIVVGYGTIKKSDLTGAVSSLKGETIDKLAVTNTAETLQGRIAGVSVSSSSGAPGSSMDIKIRGVSSFSGNDPLCIVDGVPGSLSNLNPDDIESMEVLKDASSAAIYGSRAANGVILIKTKSGEKNKTQISVSIYAGYEEITNQYKLADGTQFLTINRMANENGIVSGTVTNLPEWQQPTWNGYSSNTNWQDEVYRKGGIQNLDFAVRGGGENVTYSLSGEALKQIGTRIGTEYRRNNLRLKADFKKEKLTISPNISIKQDYNDLLYSKSRIRYLLEISPLIPVYDPLKESGYGYDDYLGGTNQVGAEELNTNDSKGIEIIAGLNLSYNILKGLNFKITGAVTSYTNQSLNHSPTQQIEKVSTPFVILNENNYDYFEYIVDPYAEYNKAFGKHNLTFVAGASVNKIMDHNAYIGAEGKDALGNPSGFTDSEDFQTFYAAKGSTFTADGTESTISRLSYFGRVNYSYADKYLFQLTYRQDYSSKFGKDVKNGKFPAFSAGWNIAKEDFFEPLSNVVNALKLRASYGVTGSELAIGPYDYTTTIVKGWAGYPLGTTQMQNQTAYASGLENRNLQWENLYATNIGLDYSLFKGKLSGSANYYINKREDMLLGMPVPLSAGIPYPIVNIGSMQNKGFEFDLSYKSNINDFTYNLTGTFFTVNNKVLKLAFADEGQSVWGSSFDYAESVTKTTVGETVAGFYLYQADGIFQTQDEIDAYNSKGVDIDGNPAPLLENAEPGDICFKDVNGDGRLDGDDRVYSGSGIPKFEYSFNAEMGYKGFDLSIFFQGASGYKIYNEGKYITENMKTNFNMAEICNNAWTPANTNTDMPRAVIGDPNRNSRPSTRFLEDGNYLRIKNLQIGYSLPKQVLQKVKIEKLRIYFSAQNLYTFTKYTGYDPEAVERANVWDTGIGWLRHPIGRKMLFGVQLNF